MKKLIGIVSFNIYSNHMNYGAALHSYAFQQYLKKKGASSVIIGYIPQIMGSYDLKYPILNVNKIRGIRSFVSHIVNWGIGGHSNIKKFQKFQRFFKEHTEITSRIYKHNELSNIQTIEGIDFTDFVCESDVIWKLIRNEGFDKCLFLQFPAAEGKNKVAYSPSLASRKFTNEEEREFKQLIAPFSAISTRESQSAEYLTAILGRKVDWVLDPTLLLNADDYNKIAITPKESDYILLYNCMVNDLDMVREARRYATKKGKKLIEVSNFYINKFYFGHSVKTDVGIEEFLGYFANADTIICNAFHGLCFSVIYRKEVFLFLRNYQDTRMQNITNSLNIANRLIDFENRHIPEKPIPINYDMVYEKLHIHRERSEKFINEHLL